MNNTCVLFLLQNCQGQKKDGHGYINNIKVPVIISINNGPVMSASSPIEINPEKEKKDIDIPGWIRVPGPENTCYVKIANRKVIYKLFVINVSIATASLNFNENALPYFITNMEGCRICVKEAQLKYEFAKKPF